MKRSLFVSKLVAFVVSTQLIACGEGVSDPANQALVNTLPASSNTVKKSGVTTWNLYRDKTTARTSVSGTRADGTMQTEMVFFMDAQNQMNVEQRFLSSDGSVAYSAAIRFDPIDPKTGTGPTFPPPPPPILCPGCMSDDLSAAAGLQAQSLTSSLRRTENNACNEATFDAAVACGGAVVSAFSLNLAAYILATAACASAYNKELKACL